MQLAAALGTSGDVAAGVLYSTGLGVALPYASARRSRFHSEILDDWSCGGRRLSFRDRATIMEMNESFFALNFLETGGIVILSHAKKWCTPSCPLTWHRQHFAVTTP